VKISIITPSHNQGIFLEQTIDSIVSRNYPNLDYIIIDGDSKDVSIDIIKKYESYLAYWVSESDSGQSEAINKGVRLATGDIINWLNADDYYEPNTLSLVSQHFSDKNVNVLIGQSRHFKGDKTINYSRGTDVYLNNLSKTIGWARIDQPETFFRKEAWDKIGLLNEQLHYTMDREWWMRYLYVFGLGGIARTYNVLVNFRLHEHSKTVSSKEKFQIEHDSIFFIIATKSKNKNIQYMLSDNLEIDHSIDSEIRNWTDSQIIEGSINYYLLKRAEELYYQGDHSRSREFLSVIDQHFLADEDVSHMNKIAFRCKLPSSIIHFFRK